MAVTVTIDLMEGMGAEKHIIRGQTARRRAIIEGLTSATTGAMIEEANLAVIAATGGLGSGCPGLTSSLTYLESIGQPEFTGKDSCHAELLYKGFPATQIEFNSSLSQVETNLDKDGNPITVVYQFPANYSTITGGNPARNNLSVTQGVLVSRPVPEICFTAKVSIPAGVNAVTPLCLLVGYVNQSAYPIGTIPGLPRTWLCSGCRALSEDGGFTFNLSISFQYRAAKWDNPVMFINPDDGRPPPDLIIGTGSKTPKVALETNFPILV